MSGMFFKDTVQITHTGSVGDSLHMHAAQMLKFLYKLRILYCLFYLT